MRSNTWACPGFWSFAITQSAGATNKQTHDGIRLRKVVCSASVKPQPTFHDRTAFEVVAYATNHEIEMQPELALAEMGFTELEARLYCELLRASPATGYRLSQIVGKAPANVYQALASMNQKGIVVADDDETKHYRAIAPAEVLEDLQQDFDRRRVLAGEA